MSRALARRGLAAGRASHAFHAADLLAELRRAQHAASTVYVDLDAAGRLVTGGGAGGAAAVCARARLAPHVHARTAALELSGARLRVRTTRALAPHDELLVWPDDELRAAAHVPYLTPDNILGAGGYVCCACGARFEHPNPLKVHVYLACAPPAAPAAAAGAFLRRLLAALPPHAAPAPPRSAFRPVPPLPPALSADALEALATAWGRAAAGGDTGAGHLCLYCGKVYSRKYGLKIHIRTHTGYKPLRCRHCARAFGDPSNLNKHVRLHAAPSPAARARHACALCGAALARRRDLERHLRARHAPAPPRSPTLRPVLIDHSQD